MISAMDKTKEVIVRNYLLSSKKKGNTSFIMVYKVLIKKVGPVAAILYSDLFSKAIYFMNHGILDSKGYFFNTFENIEKDLSFSPHQIRESLKKLEQIGLITYQRKGHPPKYYFVLNVEEEEKLYSEE